MKVTLVQQTPDPIGLIAEIASICYDSAPSDPVSLVKHLYRNGHHSVFEHVYFTFKIEGISRACYDDKTEVLTKKGWKLFKNVSKDDLFLTRTEDGQTEWHRPIDIIEYPYDGDMIGIKSQNVDLLVTPNHSLLTKRFDVRQSENYSLHSAEDILGSSYNRFYMTKEITTPTKNHAGEQIVLQGDSYQRRNRNGELYTKQIDDMLCDKEAFTMLLAWYLSEGSTYYNKSENSYTITFYQIDSAKNTKNRERICEILTSLGFTATFDKQSVKFKNRPAGMFLKTLGVSCEKIIPWNVWDFFDKDLARDFIAEYSRADGHVDKNGHLKLFTTSKRLADQLQSIAFIAGYTAKIIVDDRMGQSHNLGELTIKHNHPLYNVSISRGKRNTTPLIKKQQHMRKEHYTGMVRCVEVTNHTLFVRRNGVCVWCGNCSHQLVRHRHASFTQRSQRYCTEDDFDFSIPPTVNEATFTHNMSATQDMYDNLRSMGAANEDARYVLPNACCTELYLSCNLRELIHICNERLCERAQWEIRNLASKMVALVPDNLRFMLVPKCEAPHRRCLEKCPRRQQ